MTVQSEYQLENELIGQLQQLGYASVTLNDESQLLSNLKSKRPLNTPYEFIL